MAILTINQKIEQVNNFINAIESSENSYYCFVGRAEPWLDANGDIDESKVQVANNSIAQIEQTVYKNLLYGKLLVDVDTIAMVKRYDWTEGTVYSRYDNNDPNLYDKNFYVITDTKDVYKCIDNGYSPATPNGVPSTVKPSVTQTSGTFKTADGYVWKYMFTCDVSDYDKFATSNYFPVTPNTDVIQNAVPGTIDNLVVIEGGENYQVYEEDFIDKFVNNYVVQLPSTSAPIDNYYSGSSIYLKAGFGAGQIREITSYSGLNKTLAVHPAFNYYENLQLENINGTFTVGDLAYQKIDNLRYLYNIGYINDGDTVIQSDSSATGVIKKSNTSVLKVQNESGISFTLDTPVYITSSSQIKKLGKVTVDVTANSYQVLANTASSFVADYSVGDYIRVGENANSNIRRITSVNSTVIGVSQPFTTSLDYANNYSVPIAFTLDSISSHTAVGSLIYKNLNSAELTISGITPANEKFIVGETVLVVDNANNSQYSNGIVSFTNTSTVILSNVLGTTFANPYYIFGVTSQVKALIESDNSNPNITVETVEGGFIAGADVIIKTADGIPTGNAGILSVYSSPNDLTEYVIGPTVNIDGDGNGAIAFCTIDTSGNNPGRSVTSITLINGGQHYTRANVSITANTLFGNGAVIEALISPVNGHGAEPYNELGAIYAGVSKKFDTAINESFYFPSYGSYRTVGIIKNPFIKEALFQVNNFDRSTIHIANTNAINFTPGEILVQTSSNSAGVVVSSNSTVIEIRSTQGTFLVDSSNTGNTQTAVYGWSSGANAHAISANVKYFSLVADLEAVTELATGGAAQISEASQGNPNEIRATNILGYFATGDRLYEPTTNTYADITGIFTSNGTVDSSLNFGNKINQTARITLSSNTKPFDKYEYVYQEVTYATGRIISTCDELDIVYTTPENFAVGDIIINDDTNANAIVSYVNTTSQYMKLTAVSTTGFNETTNRPFNPGDSIRNDTSTKLSTINNVYGVLVLDDVDHVNNNETTPYLGEFKVGSDQIIGNTSGAVGTATIPNSIKYPDLVKYSGKVIYLENISKFDKTPSSTEQLKLIIKF